MCAFHACTCSTENGASMPSNATAQAAPTRPGLPEGLLRPSSKKAIKEEAGSGLNTTPDHYNPTSSSQPISGANRYTPARQLPLAAAACQARSPHVSTRLAHAWPPLLVGCAVLHRGRSSSP